jgi:prepilin-type N-terminal cleavage/methylation domain-containing protein
VTSPRTRACFPQRARSAFTLPEQRERHAFTLIELLVAMGIIVLLAVLVVPAMPSLKGSSDIQTSAYIITGILSRARNYAMANDTYVWVGFYEEDVAAAVPTNSGPPYVGKGRLLIATVASTDGTKIFANSDPIAALPPPRIKQMGQLTKIEGVHVTDIGAPPSPTPFPTPSPNSILGRPNTPYAEGSPFDHFNRLSSDSSDTTRFSFMAQNYTFYKTVRFNPRGEVNLNSTYTMKHGAEIALRPTHGNVVDATNPNVVAIQFSGVTGNFKVYRQ